VFGGLGAGKGISKPGGAKEAQFGGAGVRALVMHREVQAGGRAGCSSASPSAGTSPFHFPRGSNRQTPGLSGCRPSSPCPSRGPQAIPVPCRDPPAAQPRPAPYLEDENEPHLLRRADFGVHGHVVCVSPCKEKTSRGSTREEAATAGKGPRWIPWHHPSAAGMLLNEGWGESGLQGCWAWA